MITICFDEQGEFEKKPSKLFIGGFMYDDKGDKKETENEKKRIISFLKNVCHESYSVFPKDLHRNDKLNNEGVVGENKKIYINHFEEFIKNGTYNGQSLIKTARKGEYTFLVEYFIEDKYDGQSINWIIDEKASNRYDNMVGEFINNSIFYNPNVKDNSRIELDFPTRVVLVEKDSVMKAFDDKGFEKMEKKDNKTIILDTKNSFFRSLINEISKNHKSSNIRIEKLETRSISKIYDLDEEKKRQEIEDQAFLLFSDVVCSFIGDSINIYTNLEGLEVKFSNRMNSNCLIYCYEKKEDIFHKAFDCLKEKDILSVLKNVSNIMCDKKNHYAITWTSYILDSLDTSINEQEIIDSLKKFYNTYEDYADEEKDYIISWFSKKINNMGKEKLSFYDIVLQKETGKSCFLKIHENIENANYYDAYSLIDSIEKICPHGRNHFIKQGLDILKNDIISNVDEESFSKLVRELNEQTFKTNIPNELNYIVNQTMYIYRNQKNKLEMDEQALFLLYDTGVVLCNHSGDTKRVRTYLLKIKGLKKYIDEKEFDRRRNRYIVSYIDLLDFDNAFVVSRENVIKNGKNGRIKKIETGDINYQSKDHAKALSQFAQICAFMNESNSSLIEKGILSEAEFEGFKDFVEGLFEMSLKKFKEGKADYYITVNYLMHYYLSKIDELSIIKDFEDSERELKKLSGKNLTKSESRKLENSRKKLEEERDIYQDQIVEKAKLVTKYKRYADIFFDGNKTPKDQFNFIVSEASKNKINAVYALFLWSKSLLRIYEPQEYKEILVEESFLDEIKSRYFNNHPWELISLYLSEAYHKIGDKKKESYNFERINIENENELIKCLISNSIYHYYLFVNNNEKALAEKNRLELLLKKYSKDKLPKKDAGNVITYTYC